MSYHRAGVPHPAPVGVGTVTRNVRKFPLTAVILSMIGGAFLFGWLGMSANKKKSAAKGKGKAKKKQQAVAY